MGEEGSIYTAINSKTNLGEPSIFVVYPEIEYKMFESLSDVESIPDEYAFWRESFKHSNGAKKLTNIIIHSKELEEDTKTIKVINRIENLTVKKGTSHLMELYFDHKVQGKRFDLRPELPLIIYL